MHRSKKEIKTCMKFLLIFQTYCIIGAVVFSYLEECQQQYPNVYVLRASEGVLVDDVCKDFLSLLKLRENISNSLGEEISVNHCNHILNVTNIRSLNNLNQSNRKSLKNKEQNVFTSVRNLTSTSNYTNITMEASVITNVINNNTNRSDFSVSPQVCHILQYDRISKWYIYSAICAYTIGYGNTRPVTDAGKVWTIFFTLFGIPLAMTFLSTASHVVIGSLSSVIGYLERYKLKRRRRIATHNLKIFILCVCLVLILLVIGATMSTTGDYELQLSDSIYFWYISLTTIGLGL